MTRIARSQVDGSDINIALRQLGDEKCAGVLITFGNTGVSTHQGKT
jgi:hypothetical protein